ncbi:LysR family transcriptional regulator [Sporomusa termitida]|uniref:HTH-type transcriptional regulator GltC n=1 Tax=Sporomusa termitida TaxID=2377 RepID=A0A517DPD2_9FIRM|nr:LysR family transcriptional regulator [Sporomusa termitida]QDR79222.1 HTH-type transcriptional regulator GltC [Sporomusa termitida]
MDIRGLRSFLMVAQCLSFTEAAKRIYIGQSALSKQIAELEEDLGVELFLRHHRSLELTASGKTLLREGSILIDKVAEVVEKTQLAQRGIRGNLKIGCFGLEDAFLPYALKRFRALYPQINLDIRILTLKMIEDDLECEDLDLGFIVLLGTEPKTPRFMNRLIYRSRLCFLLPIDHAYAKEAAIDVSCLANDSFIMLYEAECPQGFDWFMSFCKKRGFTPKIANKTTSFDSIYWQIEAGIGISFTIKDPPIPRRMHTSIAIVDMQGDDAVSNVMAVWKEEHRNPATSLFLQILENTRR